jgi:hypothetical protein
MTTPAPAELHVGTADLESPKSGSAEVVLPTDYQPVPEYVAEYDEELPQALEPAVAAKPAEAPAQPRAVAVTPEERLLIENLHLRAIICTQKRLQLLTAVMQCEQELADWQSKIDAARNQLGEKYNIDFNRFEVREGDGVIIPRGQM